MKHGFNFLSNQLNVEESTFQDEQILKKVTSLTKFEYRLLKKFHHLEKLLKVENSKILLNLQISGGKDSMCLLNAMHVVLNSKVSKLKNNYIMIVQHFNHKQRALESDEDSYFVIQECLMLGIPVYLKSFEKLDLKNNFQHEFRNWRREEALDLSKNLSRKLGADKFLILTAHHARDHVESVLLHLLRGSGLEGLKGISFLDSSQVYLRPFFDVKYEEINLYSSEINLKFREDSSNLKENYHRNYIRKQILPHFMALQPDYENSFLKISRHVIDFLGHASYIERINESSREINFKSNISKFDLFYYVRNKINWNFVSENSINNLHYEIELMKKNRQKNIEKIINFKFGRKVVIQKNKLEFKILFFE
jgi:tRNA(Ile)-lysidine synthase